MNCVILFLALLFVAPITWAKPHYLPSIVDLMEIENTKRTPPLYTAEELKGLTSIRVYIEHTLDKEEYKLTEIEIEDSGTQALENRSLKKDQLGSYRAELYDLRTKKSFSFSSVGTGSYYRLLSRAMSFRFPYRKGSYGLRLFAENPRSGEMELVLDREFNSNLFSASPKLDVEVKLLKKAKSKNPILITVYSEGYLQNRKSEFFKHAEKVINTMEQYKMPGLDNMEFRAAFYPSNEKLGQSKDYSPQLPEKNSFLGLFYPYWTNFGRWYHVIYPTRENKFRRALGQVAYDYPIVLVDNSGYWGVGNYNSHTAIPARSYYFPYLLVHEFGHFMGLNEEYAEPAPNITELSFAPEIYEPWSQNTTFLRNGNLKWKKHIHPDTPIPTDRSYWDPDSKKLGAYKGGYSSPPHLNHKPGYACVMESSKYFCDVCAAAIQDKVDFDRL